LSGAYRALSDRYVGSANGRRSRFAAKVRSEKNSLFRQRRGRSSHAANAAQMHRLDRVRRRAIAGITAASAVADDRDAEGVCRRGCGCPRTCKAGQECLQHNQSGRDHGDRTTVLVLAQAGDATGWHGISSGARYHLRLMRQGHFSSQGSLFDLNEAGD
jgi:hypothetical protein